MRWNTCNTLMKELTIFNSLWLGFFMSVFHAFWRHLNIILIHFYWLLLLESVLRFPALLSRIFGKPVILILSQFNWLVATWCMIWVWGISEQITNSFIAFIFYLLVLYFYIAPLWVFLEYVCWQLFRYLLILIGLLTCI